MAVRSSRVLCSAAVGGLLQVRFLTSPAHLVTVGTQVKMQTQEEIGVSAQSQCMGAPLPHHYLSASHFPSKHHLKEGDGEQVESEGVNIFLK